MIRLAFVAHLTTTLQLFRLYTLAVNLSMVSNVCTTREYLGAIFDKFQSLSYSDTLRSGESLERHLELLNEYVKSCAVETHENVGFGSSSTLTSDWTPTPSYSAQLPLVIVVRCRQSCDHKSSTRNQIDRGAIDKACLSPPWLPPTSFATSARRASNCRTRVSTAWTARITTCVRNAQLAADIATHSVGHRTQVFKTSGGGAVAPVLSSARILYDEVPANASAGTSSVQATYAPASPPPLPPRRFSGVPTHQSSSSVSTLSSAGAVGNSAVGWGPFLTVEMAPTPVFVKLMTAILAYLDTGRTGHLVPEAFSRFLDDQAYLGEANTCSSPSTKIFAFSLIWPGKANLIPQVGQVTEDVADAALKRLQALGTAPPASVSGGLMPLMTLKGFIDTTTVEMLSDPSAEWGSISRAVKAYNLPEVRAWGDVPRSVLPDEPDPRMKTRVAWATAREQGARELEAAQVRAMFQAQASQNAVDLLDDRSGAVASSVRR
ncbi:hypothetical protein DFH06DRAFT_1147438 [Mycena polygramma]|nr:hypothetical protein DFH06DRAFT_1147438 [Mycena polygramma]